MFKVLCVDSSDRPTGFPVSGYISEGNIYTVLKYYSQSKNIYGVTGDNPVYTLEEVKVNGYFGFAIDRFIPLSEIDEMELVNEKQLINQP